MRIFLHGSKLPGLFDPKYGIPGCKNLYLVASISMNEAFVILMYVMFADPDEMVLGMDSDLALAPDPSIIKQK
jgi:hypothetical protein